MDRIAPDTSCLQLEIDAEVLTRLIGSGLLAAEQLRALNGSSQRSLKALILASLSREHGHSG